MTATLLATVLIVLPAAAVAGCQFSPFRSRHAVPETALPGPGECPQTREVVVTRDVMDGRLVGMALSGGGTRSAVFAGRILERMHAEGLAGGIDVISAVSGGSIAGAVYCLSDDSREASSSFGDPRYRFDWLRPPPSPGPGEAESDWARRIGRLAVIHAIADKRDPPGPGSGNMPRFPWSAASTSALPGTDFEGEYQRLKWRPWDWWAYWMCGYNKSGRLADAMSGKAFGDRRMRDLNPARPRLLINAVRLDDGDSFVFGENTLTSVGLDAGGLRVADAVSTACSAPGILTPRAYPTYRLPAGGRAGGKGPQFAGYLHLSDAAPRDNLGVEPLLRWLATMPKPAAPATKAGGNPDRAGLLPRVIIVVDATNPTRFREGIERQADLRGLMDYFAETVSIPTAAGVLLEAQRVETLALLRRMAEESRQGSGPPFEVIVIGFAEALEAMCADEIAADAGHEDRRPCTEGAPRSSPLPAPDGSSVTGDRRTDVPPEGTLRPLFGRAPAGKRGVPTRLFLTDEHVGLTRRVADLAFERALPALRAALGDEPRRTAGAK